MSMLLLLLLLFVGLLFGSFVFVRKDIVYLYAALVFECKIVFDIAVHSSAKLLQLLESREEDLKTLSFFVYVTFPFPRILCS